MAGDSGAEANGIWLWGLVMKMGPAVPHVNVAVRNRAVSVDQGWLHMHALSCGGGLQVCTQQWELEPAVGSAASKRLSYA